MAETTYLNALAGLLHDIGKFALRAGETGKLTWDDEARREYGYKHALLSADFVEQFVPPQWKSDVLRAAGFHHRPKDSTARIIQAADHLSAGERSDPTDDDQPRKTHPQQMLSIFCSLTADGTRAPADRYLPLAPLTLDRAALFPNAAAGATAVWQAYRDLWEGFKADASTLGKAHTPTGDLLTYLENLLLLLQHYTWCIPSAYYKTRPDVSLYDHSRMTGALAAILSDGTALEATGSNTNASGPVALLVGGDISGVQDFIYTISSKGATSALRGRSFYLQLLTEAITRYVLSQLELPITNVIYAGGGNFYLLARPGDEAKLQNIQADISRALLQHHRGDVYVAIGNLPLAQSDFTGGKISDAWGRLHQRLQHVKHQRFAELNQADLNGLFIPQGDGGNEDRQCQVCGLEHPGTDEYGDADNRVRKCPQCRSYETLGKDLRRAMYLKLEAIDPSPADPNLPPGDWEEALASLGMAASVADELDDVKPSSGRRSVLLALKDDALPALRPGPQLAVGRRFLVNVTPSLGNEVKPFDKLEGESNGIKRLGVLRMDVDNLGKLFSEGMGNSATLSRVASLSFAISLYFEGWVETLAENAPRDQLYSIYSGGDDLFFVGSWDTVVEFARQVRADLTPYAAGHPGIHASAGIALVGGKYPLYQAARDAGRAEEAAKDYRRYGAHEDRTKDAICFLGQVQPWERFGLADNDTGTVSHLAQQLRSMTSGRDGSGGAPKSLIQNFARLYDQYDQAERRRSEAGSDRNQAGEPQPLWGPWMWRG
ncbi:MAG: type III-A CRISPR-associated protein Cas10/Csm1, partial [Caldilinea sp.]|nr:type III-A CRISPR-associated protein Cas10/Csm1 [Caldilinea sp.]